MKINKSSVVGMTIFFAITGAGILGLHKTATDLTARNKLAAKIELAQRMARMSAWEEEVAREKKEIEEEVRLYKSLMAGRGAPVRVNSLSHNPTREKVALQLP